MGIDIKTLKRNTGQQNKRKSGSEFDFLKELHKDYSFNLGLSDKKKHRFYSEMHLLISAGIDFRMALELTIEGESNAKSRLLLQNVLDNIIKGATFSESLKKVGMFSDYEFFSIKIGEESGSIKQVLSELALFYEGKIELKRKLISTFSYPIIVLFTALAAVLFMLNFIVPVFEDAFKRFGGELPFLTRSILSLSKLVQDYGLIAIGTLTLIALILFSQKKKIWFRERSSTVLLRIPIIGNLAQKTYLTRFCQSMSLLAAVNNPLVNSIALVRKMVQFYPLEKALLKVEEDILRGSMFYEALSKHSIFPKRMISLIKVAEEVNKLSAVFHQIQKQYANETENSSKTIGSLMEPFLIIFIGLFVGAILIAMYLPLFEIGSGMQ